MRITVSYLKRLTNAAFGRLQAFRMYGGIGMSASSLHRESTDSLMTTQDDCTVMLVNISMVHKTKQQSCKYTSVEGEYGNELAFHHEHMLYNAYSINPA